MTTTECCDMRPEPRRMGHPLGWLLRLLSNCSEARRRRRAVAALSMIDAHLLRDIGISYEDVDNGLRGRHRSVWLEPLPRDDQ